MVKSLDEILQAWNRRIRNPVADYIITWLSAYSPEPVYPYSLHAHLVNLWNDDDAPALQSIYSTIRRLENDGLIESRQEIVDGRVQKILTATEKGFEALDAMQDALRGLAQSLQDYEV